MHRKFSCIIFVCVAAHALPAAAKNTGLGKKLADLRSEVDDLEVRLERIRMESRSERLSLETQKGDLEVLLRTEKVRRETLKRLRDRFQTEQQEAQAWAEQLREPGLKAAQELRQYIASSLPFHVDDRLATIDGIIADFKRADVDSVLANSKLWQLTEDELRLTAECGLHQQAITLDGERLLAEVARVGMAVLYFRLEDDRVGWAKSDGIGFAFEVFSDSTRTKAVSKLYEALRKQIRQGSFSLPLPVPSQT